MRDGSQAILGRADIHRARSMLRRAVRSFFDSLAYEEVDTPVMVVTPGTEVHLGYFETTWRDLGGQGRPFFLRSSPELHLKRVLADGLPRIYQFAPCFRNDGELGPLHCPEFLMLEYYEAGISFEGFVDRTEDLMREVLSVLAAKWPVARNKVWQGRLKRLSVFEAFESFADLSLVDEDPDLARKAVAKGVPSVRSDDDFETAFFKILMDVVEPSLATEWPAAVLWDYPPSQAALSRVEGGRAKRFEIYGGRMELCNGFFELLDHGENRMRMLESNRRRKEIGRAVVPIDEAFLAAMKQGIPSCCGNAMGMDRLLAWALGLSSIDSVMPFPFEEIP